MKLTLEPSPCFCRGTVFIKPLTRHLETPSPGDASGRAIPGAVGTLCGGAAGDWAVPRAQQDPASTELCGV